MTPRDYQQIAATLRRCCVRVTGDDARTRNRAYREQHACIVQALADEFAQSHPGFDHDKFVRDATPR